MNFKNPNTNAILEKKLYIFDMDGTIYLGENTFPFAIDFINMLRKTGKKVLFFTNNASHSTEYYMKKLTARGFSPTKDEIMTSGDVTMEYLLRHRKGKSVYLVGTDDLVGAFRQKGIHLIDEKCQYADIVVSSFDTSLTYEKLNAACRYVRLGAEYLSTHPDYNCPTEDGFIPDSGAIAAFITASTGITPTYFGKPYKETLEMIEEATELSREEMCIFGDRLYTDIALGKKHGMCSVLVLSGETTEEDVDRAEVTDKPDYVFPSLLEIHELFEGVNHGI